MLNKSAEILINQSSIDVLTDITYLFLNIAAESPDFRDKILDEPEIINRLYEICHFDCRKLRENVLKLLLELTSKEGAYAWKLAGRVPFDHEDNSLVFLLNKCLQDTSQIVCYLAAMVASNLCTFGEDITSLFSRHPLFGRILMTAVSSVMNPEAQLLVRKEMMFFLNSLTKFADIEVTKLLISQEIANALRHILERYNYIPSGSSLSQE